MHRHLVGFDGPRSFRNLPVMHSYNIFQSCIPASNAFVNYEAVVVGVNGIFSVQLDRWLHTPEMQQFLAVEQ